jgi:Zn-dependent metalloprotease
MAKKEPSKKNAHGNGLSAFSLHSNDRGSDKTMAALTKERDTSPRYSFGPGMTAASLDPETVAQSYLQQALASDSAKSFAAPVVDKVESEFKSLGTEAIPLTGTTTVKFRQTLNKIPVYGSLVTVELDEKNGLLGINSSTGTPKGISPLAKISAADAVKKAAADNSALKPDMTNIVPRLNYYYDMATSKWYLAFILEDVPVSQGKAKGPLPTKMDFVVDAHTGKVIATLNRTSTIAATATGVDCLGEKRTFQVEKNGASLLLLDAELNVQTFDFKKKDPQVLSSLLPGSKITNPPAFSESAVSAHANASAVSQFMRTVLMRKNIDAAGGAMISTINCIVVRDSVGGLGKEWINAYWDGSQMVYGLRMVGTKVLSLSADLDVTAHEMTHGVTDKTARLEYRFQSGAMNESFSDIFGIIVNNFSKPDQSTWNWEIGAGLQPNGQPFRNFSNPPLFGQPDHMRDFVVLPDTENGDEGGVHTNSGIHNKAAFNVLTSKDTTGGFLFTPKEVAIVFYLALSQQLSRTSQFADSVRAVVQSAQTFFRALPAAQLTLRITAIKKGFSDVGIV